MAGSDDIITVVKEVIKQTTKHEVAYDHAHKPIGPDDVILTTGIEKVEKPIDANKVEEAVEDIEQNYDNEKVMTRTGQTTTEEGALSRKHLPGRHDQHAHAAKAAGYANALSGLSAKEEASKWADKAEDQLGEALNSIEGLSKEKRSRLTDSLRKIGNLKKTTLDGSGKLTDFDRDRLSSISRQIESDMEYVVDPETKHLPGKHDQKKHGHSDIKDVVRGVQGEYIYWRGQQIGGNEGIPGEEGWGEPYLFVASKPAQAGMFGPELQLIKLKPDSKILVEGTLEFEKLTGTKFVGEDRTDAFEAAQRAKIAGYDAIHFLDQIEYGTAIINPNIVIVRKQANTPNRWYRRLHSEEQKHLPMRHDQKQHAGEVAASAKIAKTGGLSSAQHTELGNRLKRLSAVEGLPGSLKKRILAARATLRGIDPSKKMSPDEKKAYSMAIREAKTVALLSNKYMKGRKKFEAKPKPVVQKPIKPVQKKPVQPGQATPIQGKPKMTASQIAQQAAAVQAKKGPLTFREKAISWLDGVVKKTGDSIKAFNAWNQGVLTSTFKQIKNKQAMTKKYNTWKNWQVSANSHRSALQREIVRSRGSNVPTRAFYDLSRKYLDAQGTADKARAQFESFVGFDSEQLLAALNKSVVGEPQKLSNLNIQIENLETPYL